MNAVEHCTEPVWIRSMADWGPYEPILASCRQIVFDTESDSMHRYREKVCLMQLEVEGHILLIDTLALPRSREGIPALARALEDPSVTVFLHGGEYDVVCLRRDYGVNITGIIDTQQAALLLGLPQSGLAAVVQDCCGISLPKGHSTFDWAQRPIPPEAQAYAADDVRHLRSAAGILCERVHQAGLDEEYAIACRSVEEVQGKTGGLTDADLWHVRGINTLRDRSLPALLALLHWREAQAQAEDLPPGRILNHDQLIAVAGMDGVNFGLLKRCGIPAHALRRHGEAILEVLRQAQVKPPVLPPRPPRREPPPEERIREKRLRDWRRTESQRRNVTPMAVLPAKALEHLARHGAEDLTLVPQLGNGRRERYGEVLKGVCRV